jgi:hypothetical protein
LYGEGYGTGIQKVGNHYFEGEKDRQEFILFDVFVPDITNPFGGWWLNRKACWDIGARLNVGVVPSLGIMPITDAVKYVRQGFPSLLTTATIPSEGLVGRTVEALFDKRGHRLITKLKTKDFVDVPLKVEGQWASDVLTKNPIQEKRMQTYVFGQGTGDNT